jgi:hypothetical protein
MAIMVLLILCSTAPLNTQMHWWKHCSSVTRRKKWKILDPEFQQQMAGKIVEGMKDFLEGVKSGK